MKIRFHDNAGSQSSIYFNPEIILFRDGSIVMLETVAYKNGVKYELPMFVGESGCLWLDWKRCMYDNSQMNNEPGTFKVVWKDMDGLHICRYKEKLSDENFFQRILRKIREIA